MRVLSRSCALHGCEDLKPIYQSKALRVKENPGKESPAP